MKWALSKQTRRPESAIDRIHSDMDSFFDDFFALKPASLFDTDWVPSVDVSEDTQAIHVKAEMPGMTDKDINVTLENNVLTISGEKQEERREEKKNNSYIISERSFGSFRRQIRMPEDIKADSISAAFKNGVLDITIPRSEQTQSKKIQITVQ